MDQWAGYSRPAVTTGRSPGPGEPGKRVEPVPRSITKPGSTAVLRGIIYLGSLAYHSTHRCHSPDTWWRSRPNWLRLNAQWAGHKVKFRRIAHSAGDDRLY